MTKLDDYRDAQAKVAAAMEQARGVAKDAFAEGAKVVFDAHPTLMAFRWRQYTPHFNDGEACNFGVRDVYVKLPGMEEESGDYGDGFDYPEDEAGESARKAADKFVDSFSNDDMEQMFGDGYKITATRDGKVEVDDYDHD